MKRVLTVIAMLAAGTAADAQYYFQDAKNPEMLRFAERHEPCRKEIILPTDVNGYNVYKADLHSHTIFSDGQVIPKFRVREAWQEGLDILAITDHIEARRVEESLYEYLKAYTDKKYLPKVEGVKAGIVDLNFSVNQAIPEGEAVGLLIVPGTEISRSGDKVGHFNALFTTDNNTIYHDDVIESIKNAKKQGAIIQHNHPGWSRTSNQMTEAEKMAYEQGLIDGVEVMNSKDFYPNIIDRAVKEKLYMSANSDIHYSTANDYVVVGHMRPMTFVLAKECTLDAVKEALLKKRTIAYAYNTICGHEKLLKEFFYASVRLTVLPGQTEVCRLTNLTSIPYILQRGDGNYFRLDPLSSITISLSKKTGEVPLTVVNAWVSQDKRLKVSIKPEK